MVILIIKKNEMKNILENEIIMDYNHWDALTQSQEPLNLYNKDQLHEFMRLSKEKQEILEKY